MGGAGSDFAVSFKDVGGQSFVVIAYVENGDVIVHKGEIVSGPLLNLGSALTVYDGSPGDEEYSGPSIAIPNDNFVWISAIERNIGSTTSDQLQAMAIRSLNSLGASVLGFSGASNVGRRSSSLDRALLVPRSTSEVYMLTSGDNRSIVGYRSVSGSWEEIGSSGDLSWFNFEAGGLNGPVRAIHEFNGELFIGGDFTRASGDPNANYFARWNGSSWEAPSSTPLNGPVHAMTDDAFSLLLGGEFTNAGNQSAADYLAAYSSGFFTQVGDGNIDGPVKAIAYNAGDGELFIGGSFTSADGVGNTKGLAFRSGAGAWQAIGTGLDGSSSEVRALYYYAAQQDLYIGGDFTDLGGLDQADNFARYNTLTQLIEPCVENGPDPAPITAPVNDLAATGSSLFLVGEFEDANGNSLADYITSFQMNTDDYIYSFTDSFDGPIRSVAFESTNVIVGGEFTKYGATTVDRLARGTGSSFGPLLTIGANAPVYVVRNTGGNFYAGGEFSSLGGQSNADRFAGIAGLNAIGYGDDPVLNGKVNAAAFFDGDLYLGGGFTDPAGISSADRLVKWDGTAFQSLGTTSIDNGEVKALYADGSVLYVGGSFTSIGGNTDMKNIAAYSAGSFSQIGGGLPAEVRAITKFGGKIVAAGDFTSLAYLAQFDISWSALGGGLNGPGNALLVDGSDLIVGGAFTEAGSIAGLVKVAKWDGSVWSALGPGNAFTGTGEVYAIAKMGSDLYFGGDFQDVSLESDNDNLVVLSGGAFSAVSKSTNGAVRALRVDGSDLYAAGDFTFAGAGVPGTSGIARLNGGMWFAVEGGITGSVRTLAFDSSLNRLYAGGDFRRAGNEPSYNFSYLTRTAVANLDHGAELSVVAQDGGRMSILVSGAGGKLVHRQFDSNDWLGTNVLLSAPVSDPSLVVNRPANLLYAIYINGQGEVRYKTKRSSGTWSGGSGTLLPGPDDTAGIIIPENPARGKLPVLWSEGGGSGSVFETHITDASLLQGAVRQNPGAIPISGVSVNGGALGTDVTGFTGQYSLGMQDHGTGYNISFSNVTHTFLPNPANGFHDGSSVDIVATLGGITYDITGRVTNNNGDPIEGVEIGAGPIGNTQTDANGDYAFLNVPENTNYSISASFSGFTFGPPNYSGTLTGDADLDFTGSGPELTGTVLRVSSGGSVSGVQVSDPTLGAVFTDASGVFRFADVPDGVNYSLAFSKTGFNFPTSPVTGTTGPSDLDIGAVDAIGLTNIQGTIREGGIGLAGVTVSAPTLTSVTTDANGGYIFDNVEEETSHTLTPSLADYAFLPASQVVQAGDVRDFDAFRLHDLTINVKHKGNGLAGVSLNGGSFGSGSTNANGDFTFLNKPMGASYSITLNKPGFRFSPPGFSGSIATTGTLFATAVRLFDITGSVTHAGAPLAGVGILGGPIGTQTTSSSGFFIFSAKDEDTAYTITPQLTGYRFVPPSVSNTLTGPANHIFSAVKLFKLTGQVVHKGSPLSGVNVAVGANSTTTDGNGSYQLELDENTNFTLALTKAGFIFSGSFSGTLNQATTRNFTAAAVYDITGRVRLDRAGLSSVLIDGGPLGQRSTDAAGDYAFAGVPEDTVYSLSASLSGYDIAPASQGGRLAGNAKHDFAAAVQTGTMTGSVLASGAGLPGVSMTLAFSGGPRTATTDSGGRYTFTGIANGASYVLTPSIAGYTFSPASQPGTMRGTATHDFTAILNTYSLSGLVLLNGQPLQGALVDGGSLGARTSDSAGAFSYAAVPYNTNARLTASLAGFRFDVPWSATITSGVTSARLNGLSILTPLLTCVRPEGGGAYTAFFGYRSASASNVRVGVGLHNRFVPGQQNLGQVVDFVAGPGSVSNAFSVLFDGAPITWELAGEAVTASRNSTACVIPGGGCPAGQQADRCGVCNGDGMSCLSCSITDLSDLHDSITAQARKLRSMLKRAAAKLGEAAPQGEDAGTTLRQIETIVASLEPSNLSCSNSAFCTDSDRSSLLASLNDARRSLANQTRDAIQALKDRRQQVEAARLKRISKRILRGLSQDLASLPRYQSSCTLTS